MDPRDISTIKEFMQLF